MQPGVQLRSCASAVLAIAMVVVVPQVAGASAASDSLARCGRALSKAMDRYSCCMLKKESKCYDSYETYMIKNEETDLDKVFEVIGPKCEDALLESTERCQEKSDKWWKYCNPEKNDHSAIDLWCAEGDNVAVGLNLAEHPLFAEQGQACPAVEPAPGTYSGRAPVRAQGKPQQSSSSYSSRRRHGEEEASKKKPIEDEVAGKMKKEIEALIAAGKRHTLQDAVYRLNKLNYRIMISKKVKEAEDKIYQMPPPPEPGDPLMTTSTTTTTLVGPVCGNGTIEGAEECDVGDLGGSDCASEGFFGGQLLCGAGCTLDTQNCYDRWTDNGDGTATDNSTGLMWELKDPAGTGGIHDYSDTYTWTVGGGGSDPTGTAFTTFLDTLNAGATGVGDCVATTQFDTPTGGFAGYCDWRMPTNLELNTLGCCGAGIPGESGSSVFWSSTSKTVITSAWNSTGASGSKVFAYRVRAVRGSMD